jgi:CheY-like chemotaxis protein
VAASVSSAEEAMAAAQRSRLDVALVDFELDGEDGLMLARALLMQNPTLPVILISAYELEDVSDLAAGCGAVGFISKTDLGRPAIEALLSR